MPTEITRLPAPSAERARMPGMNSRDVTPLRGTAISIIAILVLILHLAGADRIGRSQVHAAVCCTGQ